MTERIIDFLDALVATVGAIDERYCLVEKREMPYNGQSTNIPYKYVGNGNYRPVEVDGGSVSYWRLVNNISFDVVDGNSAIKNLQATYPIRYVAMVKRDENNPLVFSQDVANILEGRNHDLQTQLQAKNVNITVGSIDTDTPKIWAEEFTMPIKEPDYKRSLIMLDITVTVIAKRECWQDCDNYPDILQGFLWCEDTAATVDRLTPEQQDCLSDYLCGAADPVTVQVNSTTVGTPASGTTYNVDIENTDGTTVGTGANPSVVADSQMTVNGTNVDTVPAEQPYEFRVKNSAGTNIGTSTNPSIVSDATITVNSSSLGATGSVLAEGSLDITVNLDGNPSGSWSGTSWEVTSAPCADATVNINTIFMDNVASGGTLDLEVRQETGATLVGSKQGQYWRIDDTTIRNQANDWNDTEGAEGTYTLGLQRVVDSDGSNVDTVDYKPIADGAVFTCTPANYGTRILSLLRRKYCVDALFGFSFRYIDDEWASAGNPVCRIRRSSDNAEQDFTADEITDGTLTTFTGAGDGFVVKWYDQANNGFERFNTTAGQQSRIVNSGVLETDSQGNPTSIVQSTNGYTLGGHGSSASALTLFTDNGAVWFVGKKQNSTTISRLFAVSGLNPSIGIADTTSFASYLNTGSPINYVNGAALANDQRDTLQAATNDTEHMLFIEDCQWSDNANWRTNAAIVSVQSYQVGSQDSEFVVGKKDWATTTIRTLIFNDLQTYYGYW